MKNLLLIASVTFLLTTGIFISGCTKENPTPAKKQCEISNTGSLKIVNKTSSAINVQVDGSIPSNMGYLSPDESATVDVTAGLFHSIHIETVPKSSSIWNINASIGTCLTEQHNILK